MANNLEVLLTNKSKTKENHSDLSSLDDVDTLFEEAYDMYSQGDLDASLNILEKLLDFDSKNAETLALMGLIHYHSGFFLKLLNIIEKQQK